MLSSTMEWHTDWCLQSPLAGWWMQFTHVSWHHCKFITSLYITVPAAKSHQNSGYRLLSTVTLGSAEWVFHLCSKNSVQTLHILVGFTSSLLLHIPDIWQNLSPMFLFKKILHSIYACAITIYFFHIITKDLTPKQWARFLHDYISPPYSRDAPILIPPSLCGRGKLNIWCFPWPDQNTRQSF